MKRHIPLAEELRPKNLDEMVGQEHLLQGSTLLRSSIQSQKPLSLILWGPPGCGKTTLGQLYAQSFGMRFIKLTAIFSGIGDLKKIIQEEEDKPLFSQGLFLFVDEIHRFNKAQQDAFLPFLENGTLAMIGATTENPSFYLNNALLSRLRVVEMKSLDKAALAKIFTRYEERYGSLNMTEEAKDFLLEQALGDGRYLLNLVENITTLKKDQLLTIEDVKPHLIKRAALYDKGHDQHYNLISALHKSVRGSDPNAALYWFARMLEGGEEPLFIARRLIRMAVEDIGLADPQALSLAVAARDAYEMLGSPEGELALAEVVIYLSLAPKSNASYSAYNAARQLAKETSHLDPPKTILNAPTKMMKNLGFGDGYIYDPDTPKGFSGQNYFPDLLERRKLYEPFERGFEREMKKRQDYFDKLRGF